MDTTPTHSLIEDIAAVLGPGEAKVWSETVVDRLAELRPGAYGQWAQAEPREKASTLAAALKPFGVTTGQVHGQLPDGTGTANRRGITRTDIHTALATHNRDHDGGTDPQEGSAV